MGNNNHGDPAAPTNPSLRQINSDCNQWHWTYFFLYIDIYFTDGLADSLLFSLSFHSISKSHVLQ